MTLIIPRGQPTFSITETIMVASDRIVLTHKPLNGLHSILGSGTVKYIDAGLIAEAEVIVDVYEPSGKTLIVLVDFEGQWEGNPVVIQYLYEPEV